MKEQNKALELSASVTAKQNLNAKALGASESSMASSLFSESPTLTYNEMSDFPVQQLDPIEQLQKNLAHLSELHSKMSFMMREVRYLLKV